MIFKALKTGSWRLRAKKEKTWREMELHWNFGKSKFLQQKFAQTKTLLSARPVN